MHLKLSIGGGSLQIPLSRSDSFLMCISVRSSGAEILSGFCGQVNFIPKVHRFLYYTCVHTSARMRMFFRDRYEVTQREANSSIVNVCSVIPITEMGHQWV